MQLVIVKYQDLLKILRFIKEEEGSGLLCSLEIKTGLDTVAILGPLLFQRYKMNEIID